MINPLYKPKTSFIGPTAMAGYLDQTDPLLLSQRCCQEPSSKFSPTMGNYTSPQVSLIMFPTYPLRERERVPFLPQHQRRGS